MGLTSVTPVRRQYLELKARYPDAILLFRLGDFYETFDEDAKLVAAELDIALTSKPMGGGLRSPLAGVPVRSIDQHLARLVGRGHRVAICEQLEQPSAARGLVRRGVVRVVSPGTALEPALLEAGQPSACAAVWVERGRRAARVGLASVEITTGACHLLELSGDPALSGDEAEAELWQRVGDGLARLGAREALLAEGDREARERLAGEAAGASLTCTERPRERFGAERAEHVVARQFAAPPAALGLEPGAPALRALGALLDYLSCALPDGRPAAESEPPPDQHAAGFEPLFERDGTISAAPRREPPRGGRGEPRAEAEAGLRHLAPPVWLDAEARLSWDRATGRALAIVEGETGAPGADTLVGVIDRCGTAPGRRWLRETLSAPLLDAGRIIRRLDRVQALVERPGLRRALAARLRGIGDIERLMGRASSGLALPRELAALADGLCETAALAGLIREAEPAALQDAPPAAPAAALLALAEALGPAPDSARGLRAALAEEPGREFGLGVVRAGADAEVDRAGAQAARCRERLLELEGALRAECGVESLKIGYHRSFGYQIELTRSRAAQAPEHWERRQSLRECERFSEPRLRAITDELELAQEALREAERACIERRREALVAEAALVRRRAGALARLDLACSLAAVAAERAWARPELDHSGDLEIEGGRHPIVEARAAPGGFAPNDLRLSADGARGPQLLLVTGPNMAGKSTYLRQAALAAVLAQAGSYVPAARARVGIVDRIFARVGAHDELARGRSTFMVEMLETARLLRGARARSLILLDEIGRGTSTWDGMAIARAVLEDLAGRPERGPRTLFATHFHELTALAGVFSRVRNAAAQVEESEAGELIFPYRVAPGAADRSYGVEVARQAGLPARVVERAAALLAEFERGAANPAAPQPAPPPAEAAQLTLLPPPLHPILNDLADLDIDGITPLEAISALYALRDQAQIELRGGPRGEPRDPPREAPLDFSDAGARVAERAPADAWAGSGVGAGG